MLVRQAVLDDTAAITVVYRSNVQEWQTLDQQAVDYETLSLYERWRHGGAWMSMETCAVWLGHLLQANDGIPLVVEADGQVIGEAEVFIGKEPEPYGHHINISTLCIHRDFQGQGAGRALLQYILQMAQVIHCRRLLVADPIPTEFYTHSGFKSYVVRYEVMIPAQEGRVFYKAQELTEDYPSLIQGWFMPLGRFQNARQEWERMRWYIWNGVPKLVETEWKRLRLELTGQPGILHLHQHYDDPGQVTARLWTKNPLTVHILTSALDRAARLGYERVSTLIEESARPLVGDGVENPRWLYALEL